MREDTALPDPSGFSSDPLTDLGRSGARRLIEQALEAELSGLLAQYSGETPPEGHARSVRYGQWLPYSITELMINRIAAMAV